MKVITTLSLKDVHKILLDQARSWRMHFESTLKQWLVMVGTRQIEYATGRGTYSEADYDNEGTQFDYSEICDLISLAIKSGQTQKVLFYWDYDSDNEEYTLTGIDIPKGLRGAGKCFSYECCEDEDKPFSRETEIPICKLAQSLGREPRSSEKRTIERWLIEGAKAELTKECGGWFEVELDKTEFPICTLEEAINTLHRANLCDSVSFIYGKNEEHKACTLTKVILPRSLEDALKKPKDCNKTNLPKCKNGEVVIQSKRKLYINFKTCARYMAFVPDITGDDHARLEDWIIQACLPMINSDCKNAEIRDVKWQSITDLDKDIDKFIPKAEAIGILLDPNRFPRESKITIEYQCDPYGIFIHAPKLLTEDGKELPDLDLYSEPIMWLPKDKWKNIDIREQFIQGNEILENFWLLKGTERHTYSEWLMMAAGASIHTYNGGHDLMVNWSPDETPITWQEALEKLMNDCAYSDEFKVTYSLEDEMEGKAVYTTYQLNVYSCEPKKD